MYHTENDTAPVYSYCDDIVIHTDSKYAIFSFGHRKRISDSVKNSDLIHLYRKEAAQKKVKKASKNNKDKENDKKASGMSDKKKVNIKKYIEDVIKSKVKENSKWVNYLQD